MQPPSSVTPRGPSWWALTVTSWLVFVAAWLFSDVVLHISSYEDPADRPIVLKAAAHQLTRELIPSTFCWGITAGFPLFAALCMRRGNWFRPWVVAIPSLALAALLLSNDIPQPTTSRENFVRLTQVSLPSTATRYLAVHPKGRSNALWGHQEFYSFDLPENQLAPFVAELKSKLAQDSETDLTGRTFESLARDLPAEFLLSPLSSGALVRRFYFCHVVTQPGSPRVLCILHWSPP